MTRAVYLDAVHGTVRGADQPEDLVTDQQPAGVLVQALELRVDHPSLVSRAESDAEAVGTELGDGHAIAAAAKLQVDRSADLVTGLGPPAVRGREEVQPLGALLFFVGLDRGGDQSDAVVPMRNTRRPADRTRSIHPVSALPSRISGWSSRSSRKLLLVVPPSMMTVVSVSARRSRASASSRVRP